MAGGDPSQAAVRPARGKAGVGIKRLLFHRRPPAGLRVRRALAVREADGRRSQKTVFQTQHGARRRRWAPYPEVGKEGLGPGDAPWPPLPAGKHRTPAHGHDGGSPSGDPHRGVSTAIRRWLKPLSRAAGIAFHP